MNKIILFRWVKHPDDPLEKNNYEMQIRTQMNFPGGSYQMNVVRVVLSMQQYFFLKGSTPEENNLQGCYTVTVEP